MTDTATEESRHGGGENGGGTRPAADRARERRDRWLLLGSGLVIVAILTAVAYGGDRSRTSLALIDRIESYLLDLRFQARGALTPSDRLVQVAIDQATIDREGRFPLDRRVLAGSLTTLGELGAQQIIIDMVFTEPATEEEDAALLEALSTCEADVLAGYFFYTGAGEVPPVVEPERIRSFEDRTLRVRTAGDPAETEVFEAVGLHPPLVSVHEAADDVGYLNLRVDRGGIVRRAQLIMAHEGQVYPSIEVLSVVGEWVGFGGEGTPLSLEEGTGGHVLSVAGRPVQMDASGAAIVNYVGPPGVFPTLSLVDVLDGGAAEDGDPGREALRARVAGKIIMLGPSAVGIWDRRDTPFSASTPAMEIHTAVIDNLLEDRFLHRPPWLRLVEWLSMLVLGVLLVLVLARAPLWAGGLVSVGLAAGTLAVDHTLFVAAELWSRPLLQLVEIGVLFTGMTALRFRQEAAQRQREQAERAKVMDLFGRYVAPAVINQMVGDPAQVRIGGERREISVMFSDIVGFTTISESLDPVSLASVLNTYLGRVTDAIQVHQGMVDKYIGDGVMALFGAPLPDDQHPQHAVTAALAKLEALAEVNRELLASGQLEEPLRIGIGINTGAAVVGNMGSEQRFEYSALGDAVNLAARLEGLTRIYKVDCIISQSTRAASGDRFVYREIDMVRVKGKAKPVTIYELLGEAGGDVAEHVAVYGAALTAMRERRWEEAGEGFRRVLELHPDDGPARVMLGRLEEFAIRPPSEEWDGSHGFTSK